MGIHPIMQLHQQQTLRFPTECSMSVKNLLKDQDSCPNGV